MKAIQSKAVLAVVIMMCFNFNTSSAQTIDDNLEEVAFYMHGARGFFIGYMNGLYNTDDSGMVTELCMSTEISEYLYDLVYDVIDFKPIDILSMIGDTAAIVANIDECGLEQSIEDLALFCEDVTNDCSGSAILSNVMVNPF
jgi:hypothetical protein